MKIKEITLDFTGLSTYRSCPEKFNLLYVAKKAPVTTADALSFGQCIHAALAEWHKGGAVPESDEICAHNRKEFEDTITNEYVVGHDCARCRALCAFATEAKKTDLTQLSSTAARSIPHGLALIWHYTKMYGGPHSTFIPRVGVDMKPTIELSLSAPLAPGIIYKGRMDLFADEVVSGKPVGVEHKTTYYLNEQFLNRSRLNDQVTGYIHLLRETYALDVDTIVWNGLQTTPKKIQIAPEECFARTSTRRTDEQIEEWKKNTISIAHRIVEDIEKGFFTRSMPEACFAWNTTCAFSDVCNAPCNERAGILAGSYGTNDWEGVKVVCDA